LDYPTPKPRLSSGFASASVITANPAMHDHFKTGQVSRTQDLQLF
jgi:hypothetical protein